MDARSAGRRSGACRGSTRDAEQQRPGLQVLRILRVPPRRVRSGLYRGLDEATKEIALFWYCRSGRRRYTISRVRCDLVGASNRLREYDQVPVQRTQRRYRSQEIGGKVMGRVALCRRGGTGEPVQPGRDLLDRGRRGDFARLRDHVYARHALCPADARRCDAGGAGAFRLRDDALQEDPRGAPDAAGFGFWVRIRNRGIRGATVSTAFWKSPEHRALVASGHSPRISQAVGALARPRMRAGSPSCWARPYPPAQ